MSDQGDLFGAPPTPEHAWAWCHDCRLRHAPGDHVAPPEPIRPSRERSPADDPWPVAVSDQPGPLRPPGALRAPKAGSWAARVLDAFIRDHLAGGRTVAEGRLAGFSDVYLVGLLDPERRAPYASIRGRRVDLGHWGWLRDSGRREAGHTVWELTPAAVALIRTGYRAPLGRPARPEIPGDPRVGGPD